MWKCCIPLRERRVKGKKYPRSAPQPSRDSRWWVRVFPREKPPRNVAEHEQRFRCGSAGRRGGIKSQDCGENGEEGREVGRWMQTRRSPPVHEPSLARFGKSELRRRDRELMDVSRMDIFCSVAIYGWKGAGGGGGGGGRGG